VIGSALEHGYYGGGNGWLNMANLGSGVSNLSILGDGIDGKRTMAGYHYGDNQFDMGRFALGQKPDVVTIANGSTLDTTTAILRVTASGAVTELRMQPGVMPGQVVTVLNESEFNLSFGPPGTSGVADGTSDVIIGLTSRIFVWDAARSLWFKAN